MAHRPLFVFGTLRQGRSNHYLLVGRFDRMERAELAGYGKTVPLMIAPRENSSVAGELYFLKERQYAATLSRCDELEEIVPGTTAGHWYRRNLVQVDTSSGRHLAWAYVDSDVPPEFPDEEAEALLP